MSRRSPQAKIHRQKAIAELGFSTSKRFSQAKQRAVRRRMLKIRNVERDRPYMEQRMRRGQERAEQRKTEEPARQARLESDNRQKRAIEERYAHHAREKEWETRERQLRGASSSAIANELLYKLYSSEGELGKESRRLVSALDNFGRWSPSQRLAAIELLRKAFLES